jgi:hypothetical protein
MHLKGLLNTMLTWHAQAHHPAGYDTWMGSRFLEEWADLRAVAELSMVFAHYDRDDIARALLATMALYRRLEQETAARWGFTVPSAREREVSAIVERLLAEL